MRPLDKSIARPLRGARGARGGPRAPGAEDRPDREPYVQQDARAADAALHDVQVPTARRERGLARHDEAIEPGEAWPIEGAGIHRVMVDRTAWRAQGLDWTPWGRRHSAEREVEHGVGSPS